MNWRVLLNWIGDRLATLPLAIVYATDRCNSKCTMCDFWRHGETDLPVEQARWLAAELEDMGTRAVLLTGGEALLHPQWKEVAATFREAGLGVWLLTAGLSLEKEASGVAELCQRVTVSLDGATPEIYRTVRGVDAFNAVCRGIQAAVARDVWVSLRVTIQRANYHEMPDLVRLAKDLGVREISFLGIDVSNRIAFARRNGHPPPGALGRDDLPLFAQVLERIEKEYGSDLASGFVAEKPEKLWQLHRYFSALLGQGSFPPVRCNAPRFSAVVRPDGSLQPCFFIDGVGKLEADSGRKLSEALNTPRFRDLRRSIRGGSREECKRCVCSIRKNPGELLFETKGGGS